MPIVQPAKPSQQQQQQQSPRQAVTSQPPLPPAAQPERPPVSPLALPPAQHGQPLPQMQPTPQQQATDRKRRAIIDLFAEDSASAGQACPPPPHTDEVSQPCPATLVVHGAAAALEVAAADPDPAAAAAAAVEAAQGLAAAPAQQQPGGKEQPQDGSSGRQEMALSPARSAPASPTLAVEAPPEASQPSSSWAGYMRLKSGGVSSGTAGSGIAVRGRWWQPGVGTAVGPAAVSQGCRQAKREGAEGNGLSCKHGFWQEPAQ